MGRAKDSSKLSLVDSVGSPLPEVEFLMINDRNFSVPFEAIKIVDRRDFAIPGLRTPEEAVKQKFMSQKNVFPVKVWFHDGNNMFETCFVVNGRKTVDELATMAHAKFDVEAEVEIEVLADEKVLPYDTLLLKVYAEYMSSDGLLEVLCRVAPGGVN